MVNFKQLLLSKLNQRKGNILNINFTWYVYSLLFKLHIISPDSPHVNEPFIFFVVLSPFCKWPLQNLWVRKGKWCHSQTTSKVQNYVHTTQLAVEPWLNPRYAVLESKAPPLLPRKKEKKKRLSWSEALCYQACVHTRWLFCLRELLPLVISPCSRRVSVQRGCANGMLGLWNWYE